MGKSVAPYSHVLNGLEAEFRPFRRALRKEDQERLDLLFTLARKHTPAGVMQSDPEPFRLLVLSVLLELLRMLQERHDGPAQG